MNVPTLFAYASSQRSPKLSLRSVASPVGLRRLFVGLVCAGLLSLPALAVEVTEDDLLLLDIVLERQTLASSVTAYAVGDEAYVSLSELAAALEFPIAVDPAAGRASGWLIRPERVFELDLRGRQVKADGKVLPLSADDAMLHGNALLVSVEVLTRWFPVDFSLNTSALALEVSPRETLPVQARQARRAGAQSSYAVGPATLPRIETPYRLIGPPVADIGLGYSISRREASDKAQVGFNYSGLVAGDLGYMDARVFFSGTRDDSLSDLRASVSRDNLGAPLGLRYIEIGDIVPAYVPGLTTSGVERGVMIQGGGSVTGRDDLIGTDYINLSGDALPGWDVEVFQNGMRVGFQTVGPDGRYSFPGLDPMSGANEFELVFYGPAGERRTEKVTRYSGLEPDQPGSVRYQLSVSEKGQQLYESDTQRDARARLSDIGTARIAGGLEVRVLPSLALRSSWNSVVVDGERLDYYSVGGRANVAGVTVGVDATRDPLRGGTRWDASVQAPASFRLWGFDTRFTHTHYAQSALLRDTELGEEEYELKLRSRTGLNLNRNFSGTAIRLGAFHNRDEDRNSTSFSAGFTQRVSYFSFGNTLNYYRYSADKGGIRLDDRVDGNLFFSTRINPLSLRGGLNYILRPDARAQRYFIDTSLRVARDMSMAFGLTHTPKFGFIRSMTRYSAGLNWTLPEVTLSPRITYDSDGNYGGYVYASFSLAPRPDGTGVLMSGRSMATSGSIAARAFLDNDGDRVFGPGDAPLPNVKIQAPQAYARAETGADGVALLTSLPARRATDVSIDNGSLPAADLMPTHAGKSVSPRPALVTQVDFPVVPTGDIQGKVLERKDGLRRPRAGVLIELRGEEGELYHSKTSAHDGYYVFEQVPYGRYELAIADNQGVRGENRPLVVVSRDYPAVSDVDLIVAAAETSVPALTPPAPTSITPAVVPAAPVINEAPRNLAPLAAAKPTQQMAAPAVVIPAAPARAAQPKALRPGRDGRFVQLGAYSDRARANSRVDELVGRGLIAADQIEIVESDRGARGVFQIVRASPGQGSAEALCRRLKGAGDTCFTAMP